jgi:predicted AAA+ superfamily ATPase
VSKKKADFQRPQAAVLAERLAEPRRFVQVVAGPRHVGKSTLLQQVTAELDLSSCTYCLVSDRRSTALNWEGVVPSHVRKAR